MRPFLLFFFSFFCLNVSYTQTTVILDADLDSDVDDVAALAMLHHLAATGQVKIAGVIVTSDDPYAPVCADAVNTYFGTAGIPIGFLQNQPNLKNHSRYTRQISEEFPHHLQSYKDAWEAVSLYRSILSSSADGSVTIVSIGHLTSLQNLLKSTGDVYSSLSGKELALKKVSKWICMGGMFPSGKEANFYRPDPLSTRYCLQEWTNPVVFCGWEVGKEIITGGGELKKDLTTESPVFRSFELYNNFAGRPSWDQVAVLLLTTDSAKYFNTISDGYCHVELDGSNRWVTGTKSNHAYIVIKPGTDNTEISARINNMTKKINDPRP